MHKVHLDTDLGGNMDDLCALDEQNEKKYGESCEGLPRDIINFLHDPLACAIALGWDEGVEFEELSLVFEEKDGWLHERLNSSLDPSGKRVPVVTKIDGPRFNEFWFWTITNR